MKRNHHIILVDDHQSYIKGLKTILTIGNIATVADEVSKRYELIELLWQLNPGLALIDIDMPLMNGILATRKSLELHPDLKIIA